MLVPPTFHVPGTDKGGEAIEDILQCHQVSDERNFHTLHDLRHVIAIGIFEANLGDSDIAFCFLYVPDELDDARQPCAPVNLKCPCMRYGVFWERNHVGGNRLPLK